MQVTRIRLLIVLTIIIVSSFMLPVVVAAQRPVGNPYPSMEFFYELYSNFFEDDIHWLHISDYENYLSDPPPEDEFIPPSFVWHPDMVINKFILRREEGLEMSGIIPQVTPLFGADYEIINQRIDLKVEARIVAAKEAKARRISFAYEVYDTPDLISVIVYSTTSSVTSKSEVFSVNFRPETAEAMTLTDAVGPGIAPLAEKLLTDMLRRNPERYNAAFNSASLNFQSFYLTDRQVVLLFDEFQLLTTADGIKEFAIDLPQLSAVTVRHDQYHILPGGYNLKMVPLRQVCEGLGYDIGWDAESSRITISRDGVLLIGMESGVNSYDVIGVKNRSLEAAPENLYTLSYGYAIFVPITFFDQLLNLVTYSVDEDGNIIFLAYNEHLFSNPLIDI
jgi:hypothetical protein